MSRISPVLSRSISKVREIVRKPGSVVLCCEFSSAVRREGCPVLVLTPRVTLTSPGRWDWWRELGGVCSPAGISRRGRSSSGWSIILALMSNPPPSSLLPEMSNTSEIFVTPTLTTILSKNFIPKQAVPFIVCCPHVHQSLVVDRCFIQYLLRQGLACDGGSTARWRGHYLCGLPGWGGGHHVSSVLPPRL